VRGLGPAGFLRGEHGLGEQHRVVRRRVRLHALSAPPPPPPPPRFGRLTARAGDAEGACGPHSPEHLGVEAERPLPLAGAAKRAQHGVAAATGRGKSGAQRDYFLLRDCCGPTWCCRV
jgi:hypothetical protein